MTQQQQMHYQRPFSNMEISSIKSLLKDYNAKARLTMRDGSVIQL